MTNNVPTVSTFTNMGL